jgi:hypothetical protein
MAHGADSVLEALKEGSPTVQLRLRYESVDNDAATKKVDGISLRSAIGYKTGTFNGFSAYMQLEDVSVLGEEEAYVGGAQGGIGDEDNAAVNQSYLKYSSGAFTAIGGRQTIIYDNARHIGNVGWRMNDQTFDAMTLKYNDGPLALSYNYIWQRNTINTGVGGGDVESSNHLFNGSYKFAPGKLSVYYYGVNNEEVLKAQNSSTYGLSFAGKGKAGDGSFLYHAEYAKQTDANDNPNDYDANYMHGMLGYAFPSSLTFKIGYELQSSDEGTNSFATPLATVHAFNGWADKNASLSSSDPRHVPEGLQDIYVSVGGKVAGVNLLAVYHDFSSDDDADNADETNEGSEINLLAVYKFKSGPVLGAKAAFFDSEVDGNDIDKVWVWTELKF